MAVFKFSDFSSVSSFPTGFLVGYDGVNNVRISYSNLKSALIVNWDEAYTATTQDTASWSAKGVGTNVNAALVAKNGGATVAHIPDGTSAGGNARGFVATDWQKDRASNIQVASGDYSVLSGGRDNRASGNYSVVGGGTVNVASGLYSSILGGVFNSADSNAATVGGGQDNYAWANHATVAGGQQNGAYAISAVVAGGYQNVAASNYASVCGGDGNAAGGDRSHVGGGLDNVANGSRSIVGGGDGNAARSPLSFIGGGNGNSIETGADASSISGGQFNVVQSGASFGHVTGGQNNAVYAEAGRAGGIFGKANNYNQDSFGYSNGFQTSSIRIKNRNATYSTGSIDLYTTGSVYPVVPTNAAYVGIWNVHAKLAIQSKTGDGAAVISPGDAMCWQLEFAVKIVGTTVSILGSPLIVSSFGDSSLSSSTVSVSIGAGTSNLIISVTPPTVGVGTIDLIAFGSLEFLEIAAT
jgi:hypothetical protein